MDWQQFKLRFWLENTVYCIEEDDRFVFYVNIGMIIIKTYYNKPESDEQRLIFVQQNLSSKKDIYFVKESEEEIDKIDVFYDNENEMIEDIKDGDSI